MIDQTAGIDIRHRLESQPTVGILLGDPICQGLFYNPAFGAVQLGSYPINLFSHRKGNMSGEDFGFLSSQGHLLNGSIHFNNIQSKFISPSLFWKYA